MVRGRPSIGSSTGTPWTGTRRSACTRIELAAYDAVRAGVPVFVDILTAPGAPARERLAAVYALAWFPEEASVSVPALTRAAADLEAAVAASALAESPGTWRLGDMSFGNFSLMMSGYGLPSSPEEMRRYVGE